MKAKTYTFLPTQGVSNVSSKNFQNRNVDVCRITTAVIMLPTSSLCSNEHFTEYTNRLVQGSIKSTKLLKPNGQVKIPLKKYIIILKDWRFSICLLRSGLYPKIRYYYYFIIYLFINELLLQITENVIEAVVCNETVRLNQYLRVIHLNKIVIDYPQM